MIIHPQNQREVLLLSRDKNAYNLIENRQNPTFFFQTREE